MAAGVPDATAEILSAPRARKIAPHAATPTAIATCRNVSLIPAAIPLRSFDTTLTATSAITGFSRPTPMPATMKPGSSAVQPSLGVNPDISSSPPPIAARLAAIRNRACTRAIRATASGATRNGTSVIGR